MAGEITLKELSPKLREYIDNAQGSSSINMNIKYGSVTATEDNQTVFQIPIEDYIQESCHLDVKINSTWIAPHLYTIIGKTITLTSGVVNGTVVHFTVYLLGVSGIEALDASKVVESDLKQFVTKEQKDKIGLIDDKADIVHTHDDLNQQIEGLSNKVEWKQDDWKTESDAPSSYGNSSTTVFFTRTNKFKGAVYRTVVTYNYNGNFARQVIYGGLEETYQRFATSNTWGEWKTIATTDQIEVLSEKDVELGEQINVLRNMVNVSNPYYRHKYVKLFEMTKGDYGYYYAKISCAGNYEDVSTLDIMVSAYSSKAICIRSEKTSYNNTFEMYESDGKLIGYIKASNYNNYTSTSVYGSYLCTLFKELVDTPIGEKLTVIEKQSATTTKTDILCTQKPGYIITSQNSYKINNVMYINLTVKKTDSSVFSNANHYIADIPSGVRPLKSVVGFVAGVGGSNGYQSFSCILSTNGAIDVGVRDSISTELRISGVFSI